MKAARAAEKKKKKLKLKAKKKGGANKASSNMNLPGATGPSKVADSSSSSEEQSPLWGTGARSKRVNFLGAAKKATVFKYPTLGMIHKTVENLPEEEVREQVSRAYAAKSSEASPALEGILYKSNKDD